MNIFKLIVVIVALTFPVLTSATGQTLLPQKTYKSKKGIDSVLRNVGNTLGLKKGDAEPVVLQDGHIQLYSKLKSIDPGTIAVIRIYNEVKGLSNTSYVKGPNQKLISLISPMALFAETYKEPAPSSGDEEIVISGEVGNSAAVLDKNKIYTIYDTQPQPEFPGGPDKFIEFIKTHLIYPPLATENHVQGKVHLEFVINANGSITDIQVMRKLGMGTDEEAVRLLKLTKKWLPGSIKGKPVRTKKYISINFSLDS